MPELHLVRVDETVPSDVAFTLEVRPDGQVLIRPAALQDGASYRLENVGDCVTPPVTFEVGPSAPLPSDLGDLRQSTAYTGRLHLFTGGHACFSQINATMVAVDVDLGAEASPWVELLQFETYVDDAQWSVPPTWWVTGDAVPPALMEYRSDDNLVFAQCPLSLDAVAAVDRDMFLEMYEAALPVGSHQVQIRAELPGVEAVLATEAKSIDLSCGDAPTADDEKATSPSKKTESSPASAATCQVSNAGGGRHRSFFLLAMGIAMIWASRRRRSDP